MRTTLVIDDDVLVQARATAKKLGTPFRHVVNEALRAGLATIKSPPASRPYRTQGHDMGLRPGMCLDNIGELLAQSEGEDHR